MAAILTSNASVIAAENFITSIYENGSNLYMGVGKGFGDYPDVSTEDTQSGQPQSGHYDDYNRWTDEYNPPTPTDRISNIKAFLDNLIGIKKILPSNIMLVVPRNDWKVGKVYNPLQVQAISSKRAQDYYCLTTSEQGDNCVWICIDKTSNATTTKYEPTLQYRENPSGSDPHSTTSHNVGYHYITNNIVKCGDGYTWMFLYNITSTVINAGLLLDNWIPVPFAHHGSDTVATQPDASGATVHYAGTLTDTQITYGDCNANRTLGAYRVLVTCTLANEGDAIPYESIYRQVGLLVDPRGSTYRAEETGTNPAGETAAVSGNNAYAVTNTYSQYPQSKMGYRLYGEKYPASEVDRRYGTYDETTNTYVRTAQDMMANPVQVIYLENKKPMMREESQSEKLEIILVF